MRDSHSKPRRLAFSSHCCDADENVVFGIRELQSVPSGEVGVLEERCADVMSRSLSARINDDLAHTFGQDLFDFQLRAETQNFSSTFLLGEGGFGKVHKGYVDKACKDTVNGLYCFRDKCSTGFTNGGFSNGGGGWCCSV